MDPIAILTGASSGIGAAAAEQFVEHGYTVINVSRRDCPVPGVETLATDLADEQSASQTCATLASRVADAGGAPVCLVHNASLMLKDRCDTTEDADLSLVLAVNVVGINALNRSLLPLMPARSSVLAQRNASIGESLSFEAASTAETVSRTPRVAYSPQTSSRVVWNASFGPREC